MPNSGYGIILLAIVRLEEAQSGEQIQLHQGSDSVIQGRWRQLCDQSPG